MLDAIAPFYTEKRVGRKHKELKMMLKIHFLQQWEKEYNDERPHGSLGGKTPSQFLQEKLKNHISKSVQVVC